MRGSFVSGVCVVFRGLQVSRCRSVSLGLLGGFCFLCCVFWFCVYFILRPRRFPLGVVFLFGKLLPSAWCFSFILVGVVCVFCVRSILYVCFVFFCFDFEPCVWMRILVCFRVFALVFVFVGCFDEFCACVLALWGFWSRGGGTLAITPFQFASRKGRGLGRASRMLGSPRSEMPDPHAAASYSACSRPTQNHCAFPRGRPPLVRAPRAMWCQCPVRI